jgi:tetratricopeptide (TPR) repeat protein
VASSMTDAAVKAALAAVESESATVVEKIEMLIELATGFQQKPKHPEQLWQAVELYQSAVEISQDYPLLRARAQAGMGTALRSIPDQGSELLQRAQACYQTALPVLQEQASPEEIAEAEMNLGLVLQSLVPFRQARLVDAIQTYQRALRVFSGDAYPQEFAILQNNIAIAYLSMPLSAEGDDMRQAMAVQAFRQALDWITLIDHPSEYAMLQNNLGNALQYLPSTHPVENNLQALAAYDEALKVRTAQDTPLEYANTLANKANVLLNLPDDLEHPEAGNRSCLSQAQSLLQEAMMIFQEYGRFDQMQAVQQTLEEIAGELAAGE